MGECGIPLTKKQVKFLIDKHPAAWTQDTEQVGERLTSLPSFVLFLPVSAPVKRRKMEVKMWSQS